MSIWPEQALTVVEVQDGPDWVDVTPVVLHPAGGLRVEMGGRQTELVRADAGVMDLAVNNESHLYTPGATGSAVSLQLGAGIRVKETIGRRSFDTFTGSLSQLEATFEHLDGGAGDRIDITAVDWLGEQDQGRKFVSTLTEWIRVNSPGLVGYWPCNDADGADSVADIDHTQLPLVLTYSAVSRRDLVEFAAQAGPRMDDARYLQFNPSGTPNVVGGVGNTTSTVTIAGTGALLLSVWFLPIDTPTGSNLVEFTGSGGSAGTMSIAYPATGRYNARVVTDAGTLNVVEGSGILPGQWQLITVRLDCATGEIDVWVDQGNSKTLRTLGGPSNATFSFLELFTRSDTTAAAGHLQINQTTTTRAEDRAWHLAQYEHGMHPITGGLRWQRSDQRLDTLCHYMGIQGRCQLDRGFAYLGKATLAGTTFKVQAQRVVDTEQGRLFVNGAGNLVFHNRGRTRYNL